MGTEETSKIREPFNTNEIFFILAVIIIGLGLRWIGLDTRPLHHDESLHLMYGKYFYTDPTTKFYRYDPLLHGPVLYNLLPYFYQFLDVTKVAGRSMITLLGSFFIFAPFFFRRLLSKNTFILSIIFISFSPSLIYWSRFLREDYLVLFSMFIMVWAAACLPSFWKTPIFLLGLTLHFCVKENSYVTVALLLGFLIFELLFNFLVLREKESVFSRIMTHIKTHPLALIGGILFSAFVFSYFYTSGFRYSEGILDGLYRKGFIYWLTQHNIDRIKGPFIFHFLNITWYDFLFMAGVAFSAFHFYLKSGWKFRIPVIFGFILAFALHMIYKNTAMDLNPTLSTLKIKIPLDFYLFIFLIIHSLSVTIKHLFEKEKVLAFWGYFFFGTFFTYSFVGEKVPWLSLYPLSAGVIYLVLYFQKGSVLERFYSLSIPQSPLKVKPFFFAFLLLFNFRMALMTNFARGGNDTEFISQVHTNASFEQILYGIQKEILVPQKRTPPKVLILGDSVWPATWYFFGLEEYNFTPPIDGSYAFYDYVITNVEDNNARVALEKTHERQIIPLRSWWVPDYDAMSFKDFLGYSFTHNPWNIPGHHNVAYYVKKN